MSQQDTGLGWSADSDYLVQTSSQLANYRSFGGSSFPGQPIPLNCASDADVISGGFIGYSVPSENDVYYFGTVEDAEVVMFSAPTTAGQPDSVHLVAATSGIHVKRVRVKTTSGAIISSTTYELRTSDSTYGYYYHTRQMYYSDWNPIVNIPWFSTRSDGFAAIQVIDNWVYKLNPGYAVACVVKWRDFAPATYWTPILISTDANAVALSMDGQTEYAYAVKSTKRYDGVNFYISYIRGLDGEPTSYVPKFDANAEFIGPGGESISLINVFNAIASEDHANILVTETVDPYDPFGNTEEGGGEVDPDPEDDDIEEPTLPGLSFAATGLCRIYRADLIALRQLANYMWTDDTFLQTLINHAIQLIENPMDAIISLCLVPVAPPAFSVGSAEAVSVMYIPTPAAMWPVINQFARVDCGTLNLEETYGSALDYNPYTKVSCFLPYIGFVDLDTDEVMGKTLNVVYRIDVVTGVCVAMIKVNGEVMYQFSGHCAIQMPLSSADFSTVISSLLQAGKLVAGAALTAAGAPEVGGMLLDAPQVSQPSTTVRKMVGTERNPNTGRQITTGTVTETVEKTGKPLALGELAKRQSANTVGAIMNSKFGIEHSGGFSGNSGYLGVRRPFIIVKRPRLANPEQYGQYNGRPSMIYLNLGTCTGYTEVQSIQLTGIAATNSELSEIATLLKTGVIL